MKIEEVFNKESQSKIITELKSKRCIDHSNYQLPKAKKSLLKKVQGYTVDETKTVYVDSGRTKPGEKSQPKVKEVIITEKHVPPSLDVIINFLNNNNPKIKLSKND